MNILFTTSTRVSPNSGGFQRVTETLAKEFISKGISTCYLSFSKGENETILGVDQYYLPYGKDFNNNHNSAYFKKLIDQKKINIIINQIGFSINDLKFIKSNIDTTIKILTVHHNCLKGLNEQYHNIYGSTLKAKGLYKFFNHRLGWFFLRKVHKIRFRKVITETIKLSDKVVLLSDKYIPEINFYVPNANVSKVIGIPNPNPYSNIVASVNNKENILLYVGRLDYGQKRVDRLIKIWGALNKDFPDWDLHIVGDGSMREKLEIEISENDISRVHFHGFMDPKVFYKKAKILCLTSSYEGHSMVLNEAQTFGVVPISFNCFTAISDVIENKKTGIIIEEFNIETYKNSLKKIMENEIGLKKMAKGATSQVQKYNVSLIANEWINLFKQL